MTSSLSLDDARTEYARQRFLAMPIAGAIGWTAAGVCGVLFRPRAASLLMFVCVGAIFWLGVAIGSLLGEPIVSKTRKKFALDGLFLQTVLMANLVWAIAIPFYLEDYTSLPLTLGILSGLMWVPFSWMIRHWVGIFHGVTRTILVLAAWYAFPSRRFVAVPAVIVAMYAVTIWILATRRRTAWEDQSAARAPSV